MPRKSVIIQADQFVGLDLSTAKIRMAAGSAQKSLNFDYRREGTARVRAGYARLIAGETTVSDEGVVNDNFDALGDDVVLGTDANWTSQGNGSEGNIKGTAGGRIDNPAAAEPTLPDRYGVVKYTGSSSFTDSHYAKCKVFDGSGSPQNQVAGPACRIGAAGCYMLNISTVNLIIYSVPFNGDAVVILETALLTYSSGDTVRLEAMGSGLRAFHNGVEVIAVESSLYSSGVPGVMFEQSGLSNYAELEDFEAGELRTTDTVGAVSGQPSRLFAFERDDDQVILMVAHGASVESFKAGRPEWDSDD